MSSVNPNDPAFDPNREILGSRALGRAATTSDAFATELSKLGNGFFLSLARVVGSDKAEQMLKNNVQITSDFQKGIENADPMAGKVGKYAAIADGAIMTTPIWGTSLSRAAVTGYAGALSSMLADMGSDKDAPSREAVINAATGPAALIGGVGAGIGNGILKGGMALESMARNGVQNFMKGATHVSSRSLEATAEGIPPEKYQDAGNDIQSAAGNAPDRVLGMMYDAAPIDPPDYNVDNAGTRD